MAVRMLLSRDTPMHPVVRQALAVAGRALLSGVGVLDRCMG